MCEWSECQQNVCNIRATSQVVRMRPIGFKIMAGMTQLIGMNNIIQLYNLQMRSLE